MYIQRVQIENIRSVRSFKMSFEPATEPGWHVLIGDNGAGKSAIMRSVAAALVGPVELTALRLPLEQWITSGETSGTIRLTISFDRAFDQIGRTRPSKNEVENLYTLTRGEHVVITSNAGRNPMNPMTYNWGKRPGWFSAAYGPFRRFTGGSDQWDEVFRSFPRAAAHASVFSEDVALTEALKWLKELDRRRMKERESQPNQPSDAGRALDGVRTFINTGGLLPHGTRFEGINVDGEAEFRDANGCILGVTQLSDGYRSVLSLSFELIRQLIVTYGVDSVFPSGTASPAQGPQPINLPGVVLIDEVDAHLHPTWQTRIGQWFTAAFPKLQFIVTTHSPLVCRASNCGSIWRLPSPGTNESPTQVTGVEKDRLIYGDVLDAYDTEVFGPDLTRGTEGLRQQEIYRKLMYKESFKTRLSTEEQHTLQRLRAVFGGYAFDHHA